MERGKKEGLLYLSKMRAEETEEEEERVIESQGWSVCKSRAERGTVVGSLRFLGLCLG